MKTRHQIAAYLGLLGMTTLIAILWSIRDKLISIAPWVLGVLLTVIGLIMAWLLHKLYVNFKKDRLALQARIYEVEGQKQTLRLENERWQVERASLLLGQHIQSARIYPDGKGFMPMLVNTTDAGYQYISLPHPAHQGRIAGRQSQQMLPEYAESREEEAQPHDLPAGVRYEDICDQIPVGHSCLGVSERGLETCDFKDLMTMLISGGSSTGKSNTVAIKLREAMEIGRNTGMIVIDPHKNKPDSLYNKIKQYEHRFLAPVAQKDEEIIQALRWFKQEFERRMEMSTQELAQLDDILLVCDEVYSLVYHREDDRIKSLIKLVSGIAGYESRGYGMYAWFLTQKVTGLKWLRDAVMTTICHKMQTMAERKLAANDDAAIARDMDNWTMKGRVVVFGLNLPVTITQMPLLRVVEEKMEDLQPKKTFPNSTIHDFQSQQWKSSDAGQETAQEKPGNEIDTESQIDAFVLKNFLLDARKRRAEGIPLNTILKDYGLPSGGRMHQEVKELLDAMDAQGETAEG